MGGGALQPFLPLPSSFLASVFPVITGSRWSPVGPGTLWTRAQAQLCAEAALASVTAFVNRPAGVVRAGLRAECTHGPPGIPVSLFLCAFSHLQD